MVPEAILSAGEQETVWIQGLSARILVGSERSGGRCALVEHPIMPRALAAPLHTHADEDEIAYVMEGRVSVQIGDEVREVGPGAAIVKPRGVPHAFWNAGDAPARILEVITPAGFEGYFAEAAAIFSGDGPPDPARMGTLLAQYRLQMDLASIPS